MPVAKLPFDTTTSPFSKFDAQLAQQLTLPNTASLALPGPLPLPAGIPGRAWFDSAFDADGELLPVRACDVHDNCESALFKV
jgi:hypothetical protein